MKQGGVLPDIDRDSIDRPIFVIGTGRSGTTLFFHLLAMHPDLAWFSNFGNRWYRHAWPALLSRVRDVPGIDRFVELDRRFMPHPAEAYAILDELTNGAFTSDRRLGAEDVTPEVRDRFRRRVAAVMRYQGRTRFAHKHTGFARTRYLRTIFPDARFIDVYRDGRAVAASLARVDWWRRLESWRWGPMRSDYAEEYLRSGRNPLVLAAINWKTLMDEIEDECRDLPAERLLRVRYDDLIADPHEVLSKVVRFAELRESPRFWRRIRRQELHENESKWRMDLDDQQREMLEKSLSLHLQKYGFDV
ncbi:MAG: sulfotransferase [Myxococcota bacterium]